MREHLSHVYIGPDRPEEGLRKMMECRPRAHRPGTSRLVRQMRRTIETPIGDVISVPRANVIERRLLAPLFRRN